MKRINYYFAWFNYKLGWIFTSPRKLERMGKIYKEKYEESKSNLYG